MGLFASVADGCALLSSLSELLNDQVRNLSEVASVRTIWFQLMVRDTTRKIAEPQKTDKSSVNDQAAALDKVGQETRAITRT